VSYSVDWIAKEVTIPTADLTLVSGTRYSLDMADFLAEIRRLEWEPTEGLWAPAIVDHSNTRFDFAGVDYAPFDDVINGYTIQFSGVATRVDLLGSNNDLVDVLIVTGVSVVPSNSAGLQIVSVGSGLSVGEQAQLADIHGQIRRGVFINTEALVNGDGYQQTPYDNFTDAVDDAEANGLQTLYLEADAVVDRQLKNFEIIGIGGLPELDLNDQIMDGSTLRLLNATGTQGDGGTFKAFECQFTNLTDFSGAALVVGGVGFIAFKDGTTSLLDELIPFVGDALITLDLSLGGAASVISVEKCSGDYLIKNMDHVDDTLHITFDGGGHIEIDASCTAGNIILHGSCLITDNSVGTTVDTDAVDHNLVFSHVLENGETFGDQAKLLRAAAAGTVVQQPDGSYVIKSADGTINRITGDDSANSGRDISAVDSS
jgi:hypothetical protein